MQSIGAKNMKQQTGKTRDTQPLHGLCCVQGLYRSLSLLPALSQICQHTLMLWSGAVRKQKVLKAKSLERTPRLPFLQGSICVACTIHTHLLPAMASIEVGA